MAETVTVGKTTYAILFPDLMRPLSEREYQDLKNSIRKRGIENPVILDEENGIIDGANRARIAAEVGLKTLHHRVVKCANEEEKLQLAMSLNLDRRHLSPTERKAATEARRERVKVKHEEGKSTRQIAQEEGVDHSTIVRDLLASVTGGAYAPPVTEKTPEVENRRERVEKQWNEGKSTREIAEAEGVSPMTISRDLQRVKEESQEPVIIDEPRSPFYPFSSEQEKESYDRLCSCWDSAHGRVKDKFLETYKLAYVGD